MWNLLLSAVQTLDAQQYVLSGVGVFVLGGMAHTVFRLGKLTGEVADLKDSNREILSVLLNRTIPHPRNKG